MTPPFRRLVDVADHDKVDLDASLVLRAEASAALFKYWDMASPPHVVSHDNGGLVSLRLLLDHSIKFASLCLIDVVAIGPFGLPFFKLVAENEGVFTAIPTNLVEGLV
jgi:pimeloyl-ACP methyl ester carboxylesterase